MSSSIAKDRGDLWDHPQPFLLETSVRAEDIDGLNHTNNTVYVKWCEQVAWAHSVSLGLDLDAYRAVDRAMVITYSEYNYLAASREGENVSVATWITQWDRKLTMARRFQVIRHDDGVTLLRAGMRLPVLSYPTDGRAGYLRIHRRLWTRCFDRARGKVRVAQNSF